MEKKRIDYLKQEDFLNPVVFNQNNNVLFVGSGASGSNAALCLAKMGVDITVIDKDQVNPHNLPNQCFSKMDIGKEKVLALKELMESMTGAKIEADIDFLTEDNFEYFSDFNIVFIFVDDLEARRDIMDFFIDNDSTELIIETALGTHSWERTAINKAEDTYYDEYLKWDKKNNRKIKNKAKRDAESDPTACSVEHSLFPVIMNCVSYVSYELIPYSRGGSLPAFVSFDMEAAVSTGEDCLTIWNYKQ